MADSKRPRARSQTGSGNLRDDDRPLRDPPPEFAGKRARSRVREAPAGGIEIQVVREEGIEATKKQWRAAEVWTRHRVYGLDSHLVCIEVLSRTTGKPEPDHSMIGSRLGGGRLREASSVRFSYPFPLPGMEAMFAQGKKYGYTSLIERFVVRVRILDMSGDAVLPTWEELANRARRK